MKSTTGTSSVSAAALAMPTTRRRCGTHRISIWRPRSGQRYAHSRSRQSWRGAWPSARTTSSTERSRAATASALWPRSTRHGRCGRRCSWEHESSSSRRELHRKERTASTAIGGADAATHALEQRRGDEQSETAALVALGGEEWFEDAPQVLHRDA